MKSKRVLIYGAMALVGVFMAALATGNLPTQGSSGSEVQQKRCESGRGSDHGSESKIIRLSDETITEEGIEVSPAGPGTLHISVSLPGEVAINGDRMAHVVPRMGGIVREVRKKAGDVVHAGEVMAVMESRELAEAKAKYLAGMKKLQLAKDNFMRFEILWKKETIPEKQYLEVKTALEEAEIERDSAEQKLRATGFSEDFLRQLPTQSPDLLSHYEIEAPFDGTVIKRHITLGEMLKDDAEAFVVADLSSVWVNIHVYPKDLSRVREGQQVIISTGNGIPDIQGTIEYVEPIVGDTTRAAVARVVLLNPDQKWRPGTFVTAKVVVDHTDVPVLVPKTSLKIIEGKPVAFVREKAGFEPRTVKTGRFDDSHMEIVSGLQSGELYASNGSFLLKAEAGKADAHED